MTSFKTEIGCLHNHQGKYHAPVSSEHCKTNHFRNAKTVHVLFGEML